MFYDDTGEAIIDTTRDGYSVFETDGFGRMIRPEDAKDWEIVPDAIG
jgi:hypothetical protein